jgi:hypothetical protein
MFPFSSGWYSLKFFFNLLLFALIANQYPLFNMVQTIIFILAVIAPVIAAPTPPIDITDPSQAPGPSGQPYHHPVV